jgi:hypothetical protein
MAHYRPRFAQPHEPDRSATWQAGADVAALTEGRPRRRRLLGSPVRLLGAELLGQERPHRGDAGHVAQRAVADQP